MQDKQSPPDQGSFEQALMRDLRGHSIDKDTLREMVGAVATLQKAGLRKMKVFPRGTVAPDGLRVAGTIDTTEAEKFLGAISRTPNFSAVVFFPYGIPLPEIYRVNLDLGAALQEQAFRGV